MKLDKALEQIKSSGLIDKIIKWRGKFNKDRDDILKDYREKGFSESPEQLFAFTFIKDKYPDFCYMFKKSHLCHDIEQDKLCCYDCACPYYDLDDSPYVDAGSIFIGKCSVSSKKQKFVEYKKKGDISEKVYILSCAECLIPHSLSFSKRRLS